MLNQIQLKDAAFYVEERINSAGLDIRSFVTIDNLHPNKEGIESATYNPNGTLIEFDCGDILVGNIRPYLKKIWFAKFKGGCTQDVLAIRAKKGYDKKFIYYSLMRDDFFTHMMKGSKGTKMPRGDKSHTMEFLIPDFPLAHQQKIAAVLSALDDKIELNNRINQELEAMAKTLYDYWFVQFDFPDAQGRPYKSSGGKMVYNETLKREIPEGWEVKSLYQIADFINGLACQKYRPLKESDPYLPVIKIREMNEGISANTERARLDIPDKNRIDDGDVLFSWSATLDVKIWTEGKGALNQHIFKVISKHYPRSFYYFETLNYLQHFKMMAELRKTTMGHITIDHLKTSFIAVPPLDLIKLLDQKLETILQKIISSKKQNQTLSSLRDWLLPMLMNGQVRVGAAEEEAEAVIGMAAEEHSFYHTKNK